MKIFCFFLFCLACKALDVFEDEALEEEKQVLLKEANEAFMEAQRLSEEAQEEVIEGFNAMKAQEELEFRDLDELEDMKKGIEKDADEIMERAGVAAEKAYEQRDKGATREH
eukprot:augustus_masked-scaffold_11-processed-gene-10.59-mRNA-1 protein AED:1.00 eAED:1.00 QI:0/-1/0/0/-1/1/1/0/111